MKKNSLLTALLLSFCFCNPLLLSSTEIPEWTDLFNGKDLAGEQQPSGKYSLKLTATDNGRQISIPVSTAQTISSVKWNEAKNEVQVEISDGRTFSLQSLEKFNI